MVSSLLERNPQRFRSRAAALKFSRQLFNDGVIRGVFGADTFEDSVQLYTWTDKYDSEMTSYHSPQSRQVYKVSGHDVNLTRRDIQQIDKTVVEDVRTKFSSQKEGHRRDNNFKREQRNYSESTSSQIHKQISSYQTSWNLQRPGTASSDSSQETPHHHTSRSREKQSTKSDYPVHQPHVPTMPPSRDHDAIPEEGQEEQMADRSSNSFEYDASSIPRSMATVSTPLQYEDSTPPRRWQDFQNSYSDNEKQLIEQMKRMKKEHSHILRTYEDRINKLMAKMHELRNIAEMLENSSTKSSPYGTCLVPSKGAILGFLGSKIEQERKQTTVATPGTEQEQPPPLPPRPGRGTRLYPNKPIVQTQAKMTTLPWSRVILKDDGKEEQTTIWHSMMEPKIDTEEVERLFRTPEVSPTDGATLYDDLIIRRGRSRYQLVSIYDSERSKRIVACMQCLRATLTDVIAVVSSLDTSQINQESLVELLELMASMQDIERILYHVRKKGAGQLDHPEYLVFELSKVDHFRDRLEFMRFRYKMQWHLFEIDQQLRELHTACDEIMNSISLKNLLETLLSVGNYLNGGTDMGQADGYHLDVLNRLKETLDRDGRGNLLEFVLKTYCQVYENEVDIGCPTRFRLPEPSNMRHAAQVSFESIQDALSNLHADLRHVREKLLDPTVNKNTTRPMDSFRVIAENFFAAALEVIGEQEKVLQDTRDFFNKTVAYFAIETSVTPQQFFHIWAVFLHDCKYFWKLAHRRLAKERFELEFKYKGQMSACSLHGYGTFRAGVMKGQDINTSTQLRHVDRWVKHLEDTATPSVPPKPHPEDSQDGRDVHDKMERSPSPKPLTCTPPLSEDIHKPLPKTPVTSPTSHPVPNGTVPVLPNYENTLQYDRHAPKGNTSLSTFGTPKFQMETKSLVTSSSEQSKKSQQFSLKAWLKREREQVRRDVENDTVIPNNEQKLQSPARSLTRMFQKLGGSSNRKQTDNPKKSKDNSKKFGTPPLKPARQNYVQEISAPYAVVRKEIVSENNVLTTRDIPNDKTHNFYEHYGSKNTAEPLISPIDDNEEEAENVSQDEALHDNCNPQTREKFDIPTSDMNNNESFKLSPNAHREYGTRSENIPSLSKEEFVPQETGLLTRSPGMYFHETGVSHQRDESLLTPDSERVLAQRIPVYKAKIINNYENQGKFEIVHAVRQQAEPLKPRNASQQKHGSSHEHDRYESDKNESPYPHANQTPSHTPQAFHTPQSSLTPFQTPQTSPFTTPQKYIKNNPTPPSHKVQSSYRGTSRQNIERKREIGKYGHVVTEKDTPYTTSRDRSKDYPKYTPERNRELSNVRSVGSLIDKFDRQNNNTDQTLKSSDQETKHTTAPKETLTPKPLTMTSTPVAHRKELSGNLEEINEISPPLPPRSDRSKLKQNEIADFDSTPLNSCSRPQEVSKTNTQSQFYEPGSRTNDQIVNQNPHHFTSPYILPQTQSDVSKNVTSPLTYNYGSPPDIRHSNLVNNNISSKNSYAPNENDIINDNERDDSYSIQLRRAANNSA